MFTSSAQGRAAPKAHVLSGMALVRGVWGLGTLTLYERPLVFLFGTLSTWKHREGNTWTGET